MIYTSCLNDSSDRRDELRCLPGKGGQAGTPGHSVARGRVIAMGPIPTAMLPAACAASLLQDTQSNRLNSSRNHLMVLCVQSPANVLPDEGLNGQITGWLSMRARLSCTSATVRTPDIAHVMCSEDGEVG